MFDRYQREIHYLRLSVTDLCNLRCRYCMPDGVEKLEREAVLTYEELAGLVLGYDPWELGMQMHQVAVEPLLDKMGVQYDPSAKYLGKNGKYIGQPAPAAIGSYTKNIL